MDYAKLNRYLLAAGQQAGLFPDEDKMRQLRQEEPSDQELLTPPVIFTLRPVEDYLHHQRGSWSRLSLEARAASDPGDGDPWLALIIKARFSLAYLEGGSPDELGLVMVLIGERLEDFALSYPAEAERLFAQPLTWEMAVEGEIAFQLPEIPHAFLDFGLYPEVSLEVTVYETSDAVVFEQALTGLSSEMDLGRAINETLTRLALLLRWLDLEAPSVPPLDLWDENF